ncbi:MAG: adenosylhomocysteinase, partial [Candidatus Bathyarchaeota archaeon]
MGSYKVKDIDLASKGFRQIEWASEHMPVLNKINNRFEQEKPLEGLTLAACLHITKETAVLINTLLSGGANIALCGSNPLSTQDHVAAALAEKGTHIYAWREQTKVQYYWCIERVIDHQPEITLDDGADLVGTLHSKRIELLSKIRGGTEETTTGIQRLKAMDKKGALKYPIIAVNDAFTKYLFDNRFGTGQSTIDGILRTTNILLAGKNFVVSGYGWCGRGIAMRARGMGAKVIVTEVDPIRAMEAVLNGFYVMQMSKAAKIGDIFITATGNTDVIRKEHLQKMKSGTILANSG